MKPISRSIFIALLCVVFFCIQSRGQTFGTVSSAVWLTDCNQSNFFNTSGNAADLSGPPANVFNNASLGVHTRNSNSLILSGAEVKTFKNAVIGNVCNVHLYYRIYPQSGAPGSFNSMDIPLVDNCDVPSGQYGSGGTCQPGDQKWNRVIPNGTTTPYSPVNLTAFPPGNYVLEVYYDVTGSSVTPLLCDETVVLNNSGNNYKAFFSIQEPDLASYNPTTCNGTEGSVTIRGLVANAAYSLSYTDDGVAVGPVNLLANGTGQVILSGLNAGVYSDFELLINGCTTDLFTGIILSNPVFTPTFPRVAAFCAGTTPPVLPGTSINGISGTWNPAVINNQSSGSYTFTPGSGQCGLTSTINVTVIPRIIPSFGFGTSLTICAGGSVPNLPNLSTNNINGTWSPATVDNQNPGTYTFTPASGFCATTATFTVSVNPNIPPTFSFGNSLTVCAGAPVPALPGTSTNGITGTWSPSTVDDQNSATYTFTPTAGLCATTATFSVTVDPNVPPTFSFGTSLTICAGESVPTLPGTSDNGVTGNWSPAAVDNQNSGTYIFTPTAGLCATPLSFSVTISPNIPPSFSFGTSLSICAGESVPLLPSTSDNGIAGTWNPAIVDDQNSATYTFTPTPGLCATTATFNVTVSPNIPPSFSFGTTLTICAGEAVPALPTTSTNGITGTWSPASVDNQNSATYTFTPTSGLCATAVTFSVTVNPNIIPAFSFGTSLTICAGESVPALPATSDNGVSGTWSPANVGNQNSGTYTFTPAPFQCASPITFNVSVTNNIKPVFNFGTSMSVCAGGPVPSLPGISVNGINGTWNPATIDNQNSDVYTFTPSSGCFFTATFAVTVNQNITPTFSFGTSLTICDGGSVPALSTTSTNGITGTWSPTTVKNYSSGVYTFTPTPGLCAPTTTFSVTVNQKITPTFSFGTSLTICAGEIVPTLPGTSDNAITGTWNPATVNDQSSGTYTFTPTLDMCANSETFSVTVNPTITPAFSFGTSLTICTGGNIPTLPATSNNGINGSWSPSLVDNQNSGVYTFTPDPGLCTSTATFNVTVNSNVAPIFSFSTSLTICAGAAVPPLVTTSVNGITGTWSPASVSNQNSGTYTFTPSAGLCATTTSFAVTVDPNIIPVFGFGTSLTICAGAFVPSLPSTSDNGITGAWNTPSVDNQNSAVYTFIPSSGLCAVAATFNVTVNPNIPPTFSFGNSLSICKGGTTPVLPASSTNGISGNWSPAAIDDQNSATYVFTPSSGQCASSATLTVTVNPIVTTTFDFGTSLTICSGNSVPTLVTTSNNGITGTWNPAIVDNEASGTYTFTPAPGQCGSIVNFNVTVTPGITPNFTFGTTLSVCTGGIVPPLPATSENGYDGSWSPAIVNNQASALYTFTASAPADQCIRSTTFTVTVNPILTPVFSFGTTLTVCSGSAVPALPTTSTNGIKGTWSPGTVSNQVSGVYTFTSAAGQCAKPTVTFTVTVSPTPSVNAIADTSVYDGSVIPATSLSGTPAGANFNWNNTNSSIGLASSGSGNVPSFTATNRNDADVMATISVTPSLNGCAGAAKTYNVSVKPLSKDVFVPNIFSPNGDGKNDVLYVYGNYIVKLEMRIFNQWGEQIELINNRTKGWDGNQRGKAQPVGVYVYVLKAELLDGRKVNMKGSITLVR